MRLMLRMVLLAAGVAMGAVPAPATPLCVRAMTRRVRRRTKRPVMRPGFACGRSLQSLNNEGDDNTDGIINIDTTLFSLYA